MQVSHYVTLNRRHPEFNCPYSRKILLAIKEALVYLGMISGWETSLKLVRHSLTSPRLGFYLGTPLVVLLGTFGPKRIEGSNNTP